VGGGARHSPKMCGPFVARVGARRPAAGTRRPRWVSSQSGLAPPQYCAIPGYCPSYPGLAHSRLGQHELLSSDAAGLQQDPALPLPPFLMGRRLQGQPPAAGLVGLPKVLGAQAMAKRLPPACPTDARPQLPDVLAGQPASRRVSSVLSLPAARRVPRQLVVQAEVWAQDRPQPASAQARRALASASGRRAVAPVRKRRTRTVSGGC